jgi:tetratricopeptide (TPR) repeat protein
VEADVAARLRARVVELDAVLAEERDSPDPVARRRVVEALVAKARALRKLGCYEDSVEVWEELFIGFAEEPPGGDPRFGAKVLIDKALDEHRSGQDQAAIGTLNRVIGQRLSLADDAEGSLLAARALAVKRDVLNGLQQLDAACGVDEEIIATFGGAVEPELRARVAFALTHRAHTLLRESRVDEALSDSDELLRQFADEDDPVLLENIAKLLLSQARSLIRVGSPTVDSVMIAIGATLAGAVGECVLLAGQRWPLDHAPGGAQLRRLTGSAASTLLSPPRVGVVAQQRRRVAQTLVISNAIVDRFGPDEEPDREQIVATARIYTAVALILLGRVRDGSRRFDQLTDSGREAVAEAFRGEAGLAPEPGLLGEFGAVANLAQRARTLGQGDPRIARIAFEESMRPGSPGSPASRRARWIARLIGPGRS